MDPFKTSDDGLFRVLTDCPSLLENSTKKNVQQFYYKFNQDITHNTTLPDIHFELPLFATDFLKFGVYFMHNLLTLFEQDIFWVWAKYVDKCSTPRKRTTTIASALHARDQKALKYLKNEVLVSEEQIFEGNIFFLSKQDVTAAGMRVEIALTSAIVYCFWKLRQALWNSKLLWILECLLM